MKITHKYIARITLEAQTPLFVGSGDASLLKDALVQKDIHGFPMIQGTSLTGVLRHAIQDHSDNDRWNNFFGYQKGDDGFGSRVKISSAYLVLSNQKIPEGALIEEFQHLLPHFDELPLRHHVRITGKGVAADKGLFDNEVVYKGCRFVFEMELSGDGSDKEKADWQMLLQELKSPLFRLGQGTRNGYGSLSVESCKAKIFNLTDADDLDLYLNFHPSFNVPNPCLQPIALAKSEQLTHYILELKPDNFFIFNSGFGDEEVDNTPVMEGVIEYVNKTIMPPVEKSVIPGSSIKGAISHRICYHFNRLKEKFADQNEGKTGIENNAVYEIFGAEEGAEKRKGKRGKFIINDQFFAESSALKIFNHVAIDRFTGGALEGALFSEKVSQKDDLKINIYLETTDFSEQVVEAFEAALTDICKGLLPLGGMTTKGHGIFTGTVLKNQQELYRYE